MFPTIVRFLLPLSRHWKTMRKEKLLDAAAASLKEKGIRRFSVDELSRSLHVSKKTIYGFFDSKKSLVESAVEHMLCKLASDVESIAVNEPNALRGLVYSIMAGVRFFCTMPPHTYSDIKECTGCNETVGQTAQRVEELFSHNMELAADQGYIEKGLNYETVSNVIKAQFTAQYVGDYDTNTILERIFNILITIFYGIATQKGKEELENILIKGL